MPGFTVALQTKASKWWWVRHSGSLAERVAGLSGHTTCRDRLNVVRGPFEMAALGEPFQETIFRESIFDPSLDMIDYGAGQDPLRL